MKKKLPVLVVNLEHSKERRRHIEKQLTNLNIDFELIKAIDGTKISEKDLELYSKKESIKTIGRELSPGEVGCALTHAKIWERMIIESIEEALILEDDALIGEMLFKILEVREKFPNDWEHINFATDGRLKPFGKPIYDIYRVANITRSANRTSTYLLNIKGARKLMRHVYPIRLASDGIMRRNDITNLIRYGIYPQVAAPGYFESDIWKNSIRSDLETTISFEAKIFCKKIIRFMQKMVNLF